MIGEAGHTDRNAVVIGVHFGLFKNARCFITKDKAFFCIIIIHKNSCIVMVAMVGAPGEAGTVIGV
ncbi:hypothetical protein D3C86_2120860 [compost metagenome]